MKASTPVVIDTTASASSWTTTLTPVATSRSVRSVSFVDMAHGWTLVADCSEACGLALEVSGDGGITWVPEPAVPAALSNDRASVHFITASAGYLFDPDSALVSLWSTGDGGVTWIAASSRVVALSTGSTEDWAITACPSDDASCTPTLLVSPDHGRSWKLRGPAPEPASQTPMIVRRGTVAWLYSAEPVGASGLWLSSDGGIHWTARRSPCPGDGFDALDGHELWLVCGEPPGMANQQKTVYRSSDGGGHWELEATTHGGGQDRLVMGYVAAITATSTTHAWLATLRGGLLETKDAGAHWGLAAGGPPLGADVASRSLVEAHTGWVTANTGTGAAIYRTTDGGVTWSSALIG